MSKIVEVQNKISAIRSQIVTLINDGNIHVNHKNEISQLRTQLSQLEDQLFTAKMATVGTEQQRSKPTDVFGTSVTLTSKAEASRRFLSYLKNGELRTGINLSSGAALIPEIFAQDWVSALKYYSPVLNWVSMAHSWPLRRVISDDSANGLQLIGEQVTTSTTETDPTLTSNTTLWNVDDLVTRTNFSFQTLEDSGFSLDAFLRANVAQRVARALDVATWTAQDSSGNALPNSIYTGGLAAFSGTASGSPTVQNASANALLLSDLLNLRNSVNRAYQKAGAMFTSESIFDVLDAQTTTIGTKLLPRRADGGLDVDGTPLYSSPALTNTLTSAANSKLVYFVHPNAYQTIIGPTGIRVVQEIVGAVENLKKAMITHVRFGSANLLPTATAALVQK